MSPEEIQLLRDTGNTLLTNLPGLVVRCVFNGVFILLFSMSAVRFLYRGSLRLTTRAMLVGTFIAFICANIQTATGIASMPISPLTNDADLSLAAKISLNTSLQITKVKVIQQWTSQIVPILTDMIVVWRAWVIFSEKQWVMAVPLLLLFSTAVTTFTFLGVISTPSGVASAVAGGNINNVNAAAAVLSLATNLITTALIAYKLWIFQRNANFFGLQRKTSVVKRALFLLVESGLLYCSIQLVYFILGFSTLTHSGAGYIAHLVFTNVYFMISTMYPTIVIFLVCSQKSIIDVYGLTTALESREGEVVGLQPTISVHDMLLSTQDPRQNSSHTGEDEHVADKQMIQSAPF